VLNRVIASLAHDDVSFAKVAEFIEKDTVLAGNILRLVNSPLYGLRGTVGSVRHAVSLLGINKLRNAVLGVSAAQMWCSLRTPPGWSMASFNHHSVSVAILSDLLAQQLPVRDAAGAFVAGLFHDLGLLLIAIGLPLEYRQLLTLCEKDPEKSLEHEIEILGLTHAELSSDVAAAWNLPKSIRSAVRYHIQPDLDPAGADGLALSRIIHAADAYVCATGSQFCAMETEVRGSEDALDTLGLGEQLPVVLSEFENELAAMQPYFMAA